MGNFTERYSKLDEIDQDLFRGLILGDGSTETTPEAAGIMTPDEPVATESEEPEQGFLGGIISWMRGNTDNPEQLADAIVPQSVEVAPDLSNWESMPPPPPVSRGPITPGSTNLALYGDRLGAGTITSSPPASYTDAPADMVAPSVQLGATPSGSPMANWEGTPRETLEQMAFDALPNIPVDAEAGLMSPEDSDDVPVTAAETPTGAGIMSPLFDSKSRETNAYELGLYSDNERDRLRAVQGFLTRRNYPVRGGVDGADGGGTRAAIRHFQRANDLPITGQADDATLDALKSADVEEFTPSEATEGLWTNYVTDGLEGEDHHLGGADYESVGITLEAGIVPDSGLQYRHNGQVITLPNDVRQRWPVLSRAGVTRANFDTDNVITDNVVTKGIRRADFESDADFTKAVITAYADEAEDAWVDQGYSRDDFDTDARKTLTDFAWNAGTGALGYSTMAPVLEELAKPVEERDTTVMRGLLNTAPTSSGVILGGVMKRRAIQYNWSVPPEERIQRVTSSRALGTGTYYYADGTTYTISRQKGADNQDEIVPDL